MSVANSQVHIPFRSGADLSAETNLYKFVKVSGESEVNVAGAADVAIGVLQNRPEQGEGADVVVAGRTQIVAGAAIADGNQVTCNASGQAIVATTGEPIFGIALTTVANAGEIVDVLLGYGGVAA
jgi:hypothetical protein